MSFNYQYILANLAEKILLTHQLMILGLLKVFEKKGFRTIVDWLKMSEFLRFLELVMFLLILQNCFA